MTLDEFYEGQNVRYIPSHAHGDVNHPDCENGIVSSKNHLYVFVRYYRNGMLQHTAQSTRPEDLVSTGNG